MKLELRSEYIDVTSGPSRKKIQEAQAMGIALAFGGTHYTTVAAYREGAPILSAAVGGRDQEVTVRILIDQYILSQKDTSQVAIKGRILEETNSLQQVEFIYDVVHQTAYLHILSLLHSIEVNYSKALY